MITEARDLWYEVCERRYAPDADRVERLINLLEGITPALPDYQAYLNRLAKPETTEPEYPTIQLMGEARGSSSAHGTLTMRDDEDEGEFQQESRTELEILEALEKLFDQIWYNRHWNHRIAIEEGREQISPSVWKVALEAAARVETRYKDDPEALGPWDDFEWGMFNGKMSALRRVLGDEWDFLDT